MNKTVFALVAGMALLQAAPAISHDHEEAGQTEERVQHYVAANPQNAEEALAVLVEKTEASAGFFASESLSDAELESLHEISYSLEAAVDKLRETLDAKFEAQLDTVDEAVQALHYASESHEEAKTRKWFAILQPAVEDLKNAL